MEVPGKRTLSEGIPVQRRTDAPASSSASEESTHQAAQQGVSGSGGALPFADRIQSLLDGTTSLR